MVVSFIYSPSSAPVAEMELLRAASPPTEVLGADAAALIRQRANGPGKNALQKKRNETCKMPKAIKLFI